MTILRYRPPTAAIDLPVTRAARSLPPRDPSIGEDVAMANRRAWLADLQRPHNGPHDYCVDGISNDDPCPRCEDRDDELMRQRATESADPLVDRCDVEGGAE